MNQLIATGQLYGKTITIKRISKTAAKKQFCNGVEIYLQSSNFYPFGVWQSICPIKQDELTSFETITNSFRYYNCSSEQGRYIHFYIAI